MPGLATEARRKGRYYEQYEYHYRPRSWLGRRIYQRLAGLRAPARGRILLRSDRDGARPLRGQRQAAALLHGKADAEDLRRRSGRYHRHPPSLPPHQDPGPAGRVLREHRPVQEGRHLPPPLERGRRRQRPLQAGRPRLRQEERHPGQSNEVIRFLPPPEEKAAPAQGWTQGAF